VDPNLSELDPNRTSIRTRFGPGSDKGFLAVNLFRCADPVPYALQHKASNQRSLDAAIDAAAEFLNAAAKPVLIAGKPAHKIILFAWQQSRSLFVVVSNALSDSTGH
jgi:hypothetical protein